MALLLTPIANHRAASAASDPRQITIDVYVINVENVDQQTGSYNVDMYLSFAWSGNWSATSNNASAPAFPSHFDLTNGQINQMSLIYSEQNVSGTGYNYLEYRIGAVIYDPFNFQRFPLDKQKLSIDIEDSFYDNTTLVYVADSNIVLDPAIKVSGWTIQRDTVQLSTSNHIYNSSFAYPGVPQNSQYAYSRASFSFSMARPITTSVLELALPTIVLAALAMISFRIKMDSFDSRLEVGVISIFAAVAFLVNLDSSIPAGYFTLGDEIMLIAFAVLLYSIAITVWFHRYDPQRLPRFATQIDRASFAVIPIIVLILVSLVIVF